MHNNMANKDESELEPSSSKGRHLEPVSAAVKALKDHEDKLVASLKDADLVSLARFGLERGFISQDVKKSLESMDPNVHWPTKIRYLFLHVYESLQSNPRLYERWLKLLSEHGASSEALEQVRLSYEEYCARESDYSVSAMTESLTGISEELFVSGSAEVVVGSKRLHKNDYFSERHVSVLTEILAINCSRWYDIGTSLNLHEDVLYGISAMMHICGIKICLKKMLQEWVIGNDEHAKPPTVKNLEETLRIVGLGSEANKLQENLRKHGVCLTSEVSASKRPCLEVSPLEIISQTFVCKVTEEKSALLEVQVSANHETTITYQWMKDGTPLSDDSTYCGTHKPILCINDVTMASEGTYHCEIQTQENKKLKSEPIKLTVKVSPEKKVLIDMYLSQPEVPKDTWPPVSNNTYINLALIKPGAIDKAGEYAYNTIQGDVDDILKDKDRIEYEEVFSNLVSGTRLLIEGRPGSGKTTLVHKFSQDWARGKLNLKNIRLLFLVHLRVLLNDPSIELRDILKHYYKDQVRLDQILDHSEQFSGEGLCFVLDGLDEYSPKGKKNTTIFKLINKELLPKSIVVVASRPAAVVHLKSVATKRVEVLGFQKEQISQYIKEYKFSNAEKIQNLESYLEQHPNVHHMCYLPIHASMVCYLFNLMGTALARTETEMYTSFMIHTLLRTVMRCDENERYLQSPDDLPDMERGIFFQICKLAFEKTVSSKQVMKRSEIKHFFKDVSCGKESLGLITVDCIAAKFGFQDLYTFLHLTFQEYLAAYHITKLGEEEQTKIIEMYGKKKHMHVVWKFYCGLINFENGTKKFEKLVKCSESPDDLFHIQCAFESQQSIVCDSVIRSGEEGSLTLKSHFLTPSDMTAIGFVVRTASESHPVKKLVLNRCTLGEEGISAFLKEAGDRVMSIQTLCYHGGNCIMAQLELVNVLLGKMSALETLDISNTGLGPKKVQALTSNITLPNLETLLVGDSAFLESLKFNSPKVRLVKFPKPYLSFDTAHWFISIFGFSTFFNSINELDFFDVHNRELSYSDVKLVSKCLEHYAHCTRLILTDCNIGDDGAKVCAVGLSHCAGLKELVLNVNNIGDEGSIALAETLTKNPLSHLEKLDISFNAIGDSGAKSLSEGLILCTNLHSLDLRCNKIGDEGAIAITRAVKDVELLLCNQKITKEGAIALLNIKHDVDISSMDFSQIDCAGVALSVFCSNTCGSHYNLQLLNFKSRNITSNDAKALAEGLKHCTNLQTLNLRSNSIGADGVKALAEGLKHCTNLQTLNLCSNSIGVDGAKALAEGLKHCTNLQTLNLESNSIGVDGAKALAEGLKHCTNLQTLNLESNSIGVDGAKALAEGLKHCTNLQTLHLRFNSIGVDGAKALAEGIKHCTKLQTLNLESNSIGVDSAKALAEGLKHCTNLQTLNLRSNSIGADGVKALAKGLKHCTNLQTLNLCSNSIGVDGAKALAEGLKHCTNLQTLNLESNSIGVDGAKALAEGLKHYTNLQTLNLRSNSIGADGVKALAEGLKHCTNLQTLNLCSNSIGVDGAKALAEGLKHCTNLQTLNLESNSIGVDGAKALAEGLKHCTNLQTLNLCSNSIGDDGAKALAEGLKHYTNLQTLNLRSNSIGADGVKALAEGLKHCTNLQTLNLCSNSIGVDGAKALAEGLKHCTNLQTLNLESNSIGVDGAKALAEGLKHCTNLQTLNLESNSIGDDGAKALAEGLKHCTNLQTLNLESNSICVDGAKALAEGLKHCTNLQTLNLESNSIGVDGAKALAEGLKHCTNLQALNLKGNSIGDDGAKALAEGLKHCTNLQTLNLRFNSIDNNGAKALAEGLKHCTNLQTLNLRFNSIGNNGAKALAEGLKHCTNLQTLNLKSNSIGVDGAKALAEGLKHCMNLQTLNLRFNSIGNNGAKALAEGLKHCTNLQTLDLSINSIGADGRKALTEHLQHVKNLYY